MFILFIYYNIGCLGVCLYSINVQTIMIRIGMGSFDFFEKILFSFVNNEKNSEN